MEYLITSDRSFDEIEARTVEALEQEGLMVQRTFSLRSAVGADSGQVSTPTAREHSASRGSNPGYSVLMLYTPGTLRRPLGLITLYKQGHRTLISPVLTPEANEPLPSAEAGNEAAGTGSDAEAELVAALVSGGLELCIEVAGEGECVDPATTVDELGPSTLLVQDPVCGKWFERGRSEAGIEYRGELHYLLPALPG